MEKKLPIQVMAQRAFEEFLDEPVGRTCTAEQAILASIAFVDRVPTVGFYQTVLMALRSAPPGRSIEFGWPPELADDSA